MTKKDTSLPLPDYAIVQRITLRQSADCCTSKDKMSTITVEFDDGGGGHFGRIRAASLWSVDADDTKLYEFIKAVCRHNDAVLEKHEENA